MNPELVITAASALTPYGLGTEAYAQGMDKAYAGFAPMDGSYSAGSQCARVPSYDARQLLGVRSVSNFDRLTLHVCVVVEQLHQRLGFHDTAHRRSHLADDRISLTLGSSGPLQSIVDFDLQTIQEPRYVQPSMVPNVVFNVPASYAAIRHGIRGSCITLTDGDTSSMKAFAIAAAQLESGRIDLALVGGAEEATPAYALYCAALARAQGRSTPAFCEGAALFALERAEQAQAAGRDSVAGLFGCTHVFSPNDPRAGLTACLAKLRKRHAAAMDAVSIVCAEPQIDLAALSLADCRHVVPAARLGHAGAMSASLAMLDLLAGKEVAAGETVLLLQTDSEGACAAALLRKQAALH